MSTYFPVLSGLLGGLALFLYGMDAMTEALRAAAGPDLRRVLEKLAGRPLAGALAGTAVTAVVQSSSAVTVMVIGLVSAGLLGLEQAIPVIFGANVGTTVTAQLLAFSLEEWIYPLLFAGFLVRALARGRRGRSAGQALFSFALLLEGVDLMGRAARPLAVSPRFAGLMARAGSAPLVGLALGASATALTQSSSAAVAVLQRLVAGAGTAGTPISLAGAIPILLGCNIGTTVTALIAAAAGKSPDARRAALAHLLFNVTGCALLLPFAPAFARLVVRLSPANAARQIANAHTLFNLLCAGLWLPFAPFMTRLVTRAVPERESVQKQGRPPGRP